MWDSVFASSSKIIIYGLSKNQPNHRVELYVSDLNRSCQSMDARAWMLHLHFHTCFISTSISRINWVSRFEAPPTLTDGLVLRFEAPPMTDWFCGFSWLTRFERFSLANQIISVSSVKFLV